MACREWRSLNSVCCVQGRVGEPGDSSAWELLGVPKERGLPRKKPKVALGAGAVSGRLSPPLTSPSPHPCDPQRTWRTSWRRKKLRGRSFSWRRSPRKGKSRRWRTTSWSWKTKTTSSPRSVPVHPPLGLQGQGNEESAPSMAPAVQAGSGGGWGCSQSCGEAILPLTGRPPSLVKTHRGDGQRFGPGWGSHFTG